MTLDHNIPNLASFGTGLYRGGQPKDEDAWAYLKNIGVGRVVKLNTEPGDEMAEAMGLKVDRFPITTVDQIWGPVKVQLEAAFAQLTLPEPSAAFVHCSHGVNRTGSLIILYRVRLCGWSLDLAIAEANRFADHGMGWGWTLPALQIYVREHAVTTGTLCPST